MTNLEIIKSMSKEELKDFLCQRLDCNCCCHHNKCKDIDVDNEYCKNGIKKMVRK